ncbi:Nsp1-like protein, partial [Cooperia oncophora]
ATSFSTTPQTPSRPVESSTAAATDSGGADATTGSSLKTLLEKEGSVGSACSQLLASMTADTEISFADLSAITQKMTLDLATDERAFLNCLLELNAYDRQLWENMQRISDVDAKLVSLEEKQSKMIYNMGCITEEQKALDSAVTELEKALGLPDWTDQNHDLPVDAFLGHSNMQMLISVDSQIKEADCDLQEIIDQVLPSLKISPLSSVTVNVEM